MKVESIAECPTILLTCIKRQLILETNQFWSIFWTDFTINSIISELTVIVTVIVPQIYLNAHVILNILNKLSKSDKMRGLPSILSLFRN